MKVEQHVFTPNTIYGLSMMNPDMQRDLRHRGHLANYGKQENTRWKYSFRDATGLWVATNLISTGFDRRTACECGWTNAFAVIDFMQENAAPYRFVAYLHQAIDPNGMRGAEVKQLKSAADIATVAFDRADIIDLMEIAASAPLALRQVAADIDTM